MYLLGDQNIPTKVTSSAAQEGGSAPQYDESLPTQKAPSDFRDRLNPALRKHGKQIKKARHTNQPSQQQMDDESNVNSDDEAQLVSQSRNDNVLRSSSLNNLGPKRPNTAHGIGLGMRGSYSTTKMVPYHRPNLRKGRNGAVEEQAPPTKYRTGAAKKARRRNQAGHVMQTVEPLPVGTKHRKQPRLAGRLRTNNPSLLPGDRMIQSHQQLPDQSNTPILMGGASVHNVSAGLPQHEVQYLQYVVGDHSMIQHKTSGSQTDSD